jgi:CheY-like chemotaxis protein
VYEIDPSIPASLIGDALRLKQVLINLGGNAVKFTEQGHVLIRWAVLARTVDRIKLQISVRDTGIGIAHENQARIFEAFTQAEANTTRRFGGTGLGLVISTRLIRLMGGELELTSALGQGSSFSFNLELPLLELGTAALPAPVADPVPTRVLVVDDNPVALHSSVAMAQSLGWDVAQADSGDEALRVLRQRIASGLPAWDVVFVDARMPGQNGRETVRAMRQMLGASPQPKFVLLGAHNRDGAGKPEADDTAAIDGLLVKPLTARMLAQSLAMAMNPHHSAAMRGGVHGNEMLAGMRILLVEDNAINQQVASELLQAQGAVVTVADNGLIGVNAIKAARPLFDAVLMDLQMPVMDGLTATRLLRQDPRLKTLPVIAMTANAMATDREACLLAGMDDHVGKPFDVTDLVNTLVRHTHWSAPVHTDEIAPGVSPEVAPEVVPVSWPGGLDIDLALSRMGGNRSLLQRSLSAFANDAAPACQRIAELLRTRALVDAKRELHSFKGLAATLGAAQLADLAARAEKAVDAVLPVPPLAVLLQQIEQQVAVVVPAMQAISTRLGAPLASGADQYAATSADARIGDGRLSHDAAIDQLAGLLRALRNSDMAAMELHAAMRQQAGDALSLHMEPLDAAMAELEFERAALECEKLLAETGQH